MKTQIQELIALYRMLDEITQIIESENSGLSAEQRLSEIETTIKNYFKHQREMSEGKFVKNVKYYSGVVYEWNLPTGSTCPFALECKVTVDRTTGKFDVKKDSTGAMLPLQKDSPQCVSTVGEL